MSKTKKIENKKEEIKERPAKEKKKKNYEPIQWQAPEFRYTSKSSSWVWITFIFAIILIAFALWQKNFLFAVFVFVAEMVIIYFSGKYPDVWKFELTGEEIKIGEKKIYKLSQFSAFDIREADEEYSELVLRSKSRFIPDVKILIFKDDEKAAAERFGAVVERQKIDESFADILEKFFRF